MANKVKHNKFTTIIYVVIVLLVLKSEIKNYMVLLNFVFIYIVQFFSFLIY